MGCKTTKEIMKRLELIYADNSSANVYRLMHRYYRYKKSPEDSMLEHIGTMEEMKMALIDIDKKPDEELYQVTLLGSLPPEYETMMEVWELTHLTMRTTANLISRLLKREEDLKAESQEHKTFNVGRMSPEAWKKLSIDEKKKLTKCKTCGKKGHLARECNQKKNTATKVESEEPNESQGSKEHVLFNPGDVSMDVKKSRIVDSGATAHMCRNKDWFTELILYPKGIKCSVGDGSQVQVQGIGTIQIKSGDIRGLLTEVLYIPTLETNLVSVGAAAKQGIDTIFRGQICKMIRNNQEVAIGKQIKDNLYLLEIKVVLSKPTAHFTNCERSLQEWHRALGHANKERIMQLAKGLGDIRVSKPDLKIECEACPEGKGKLINHPPKEGRTEETGGRVCIDLSGKVSRASLMGYQYYMLSKDEHTEYSFVQFAKEKSTIHELLTKLIIEFEEESGYPIRRIQTDQGSEFKNRNIELLFMKERILHETSAIYTPQQNGIIEREMGTIT